VVEAEKPGPVAVDFHPAEPSEEAGLRVAGQVREIRRARHLSQRQVAGRMEVPRTYISKIENGKAIPTLGSLERLAAALGVGVGQLVKDARSRRDEEVTAVLGDPLLAEIAVLPREAAGALHKARPAGFLHFCQAAHCLAAVQWWMMNGWDGCAPVGLLSRLCPAAMESGPDTRRILCTLLPIRASTSCPPRSAPSTTL
jgi:transcriptional regulator with XRE-family HTH domain